MNAETRMRPTRLQLWLFRHVPAVRDIVQQSWREGYWVSVAEGRGEIDGEPMPSYANWRL